jgi:membrane protein
MGRLFSAFREAALRFSKDGCGFLAQAIAFNALFSFFPLIVLVLTAASFLVPNSDARVLAFLNTLAPTLHDYLSGTIESYMHGRGITSLVAAGVLIWSGKNLFLALAYALDKALRVPNSRPLLHHIALGLVMLPIVGALLLVAMSLPILLSIAIALTNPSERQSVTHVGAYAISVALVFIVSVVLYTFLPNRKISWRFAIPGATFAAIAWPIVQFGFEQYSLHVDFTHVYGALSAPLVLLLWFYCMGSIFLYGAEFSVAWLWGSKEKPQASIPDVEQPEELAPPTDWKQRPA